MKAKRLSALLAAVIALTMTACGDSDSSSKSDKDSKEDTSSVAVQEGDSSAAADAGEDSGSAEPAPADSTPAEDSQPDETAAPDKPLTEIIAETVPADPKSPELKESGKLKIEGVGFQDDNIYVQDKDNNATIYDYKGEKLVGGNAEYVKKLGNTGLYVYDAKGTEATVYEGLVDADGNEIISASEKAGLFKEIDDRFVMAFFPEAETTNEDEAIYYATKRQFSVEATDEDVLYTGKVKVYDTLNRKYLENTTVTTSPRYTVYGDIISFYDSNSDAVYVSADDQKLEFTDGITPTGGKLLTCYKNDKTYAYDHSMTLQFTTPYSVSRMNGTDDFYVLMDSDSRKKGIIHYTGTVIVEPKYNSVDYIGGGCFSYATTEDYQKNGILDLEGKELTKDEYKYIYYSNVPGYFSVCNADGKYDLMNVKTGKVIYSGADSYMKLGDYIKIDDGYCYFIPGKEDTSLKVKYSGTYFGKYLLDINNEKVLYDLYTGEKLQEGFDKAYCAFGRVYIVKGKDITVYEVQ